MMTTTMKSLCFCLLASTASAWTTAPFASLRPSLTTLQAARVDSSTAVADALKASKEFGATSIEARLAWEAVEDMDAADNRCVPFDVMNGSIIHWKANRCWKIFV
jgi:hypothetical protein